jgi:hypothetical protein
VTKAVCESKLQNSENLNDRLLNIAERFVGKIPEELEELDELFERDFGPDLWKRIYDKIPKYYRRG